MYFKSQIKQFHCHAPPFVSPPFVVSDSVAQNMTTVTSTHDDSTVGFPFGQIPHITYAGCYRSAMFSGKMKMNKEKCKCFSMDEKSKTKSTPRLCFDAHWNASVPGIQGTVRNISWVRPIWHQKSRRQNSQRKVVTKYSYSLSIFDQIIRNTFKWLV